jgi:hypothetical protein
MQKIEDKQKDQKIQLEDHEREMTELESELKNALEKFAELEKIRNVE